MGTEWEDNMASVFSMTSVIKRLEEERELTAILKARIEGLENRLESVDELNSLLIVERNVSKANYRAMLVGFIADMAIVSHGADIIESLNSIRSKYVDELLAFDRESERVNVHINLNMDDKKLTEVMEAAKDSLIKFGAELSKFERKPLDK